jgi:hypothetical protein
MASSHESPREMTEMRPRRNSGASSATERTAPDAIEQDHGTMDGIPDPEQAITIHSSHLDSLTVPTEPGYNRARRRVKFRGRHVVMMALGFRPQI